MLFFTPQYWCDCEGWDDAKSEKNIIISHLFATKIKLVIENVTGYDYY